MRLSLNRLLLLSFFIRLVFAFTIWHPDLNNHVDWGIRFFEYGPEGFYAPDANVWSYTWPNQPPGTILMFALIRKLFEFVFGLLMSINVAIPAFPSGIISFFEDSLYQAMLKLPAIISDLGIAYLIYKIFKDLKKPKAGILGAIFFLINPVSWYNSTIWGQTDAIINFLSLAALYFLLKRQLSVAALLLALSLYTKISLAIFVPLFIIIAIRQRYRLQDYVGATILPVIIFLTVTLFFSGNADPTTWIFEVYSKKVLTNQLQVITANAFNIWATIAGIHEQPHSLPFLGLTYQAWGQIAFVASFIPLLVVLWKKQSPMRVFWVFALTAFSSWLFLSNMHERYLYPLFPFLTILAVEYKNMRAIYWLLSGLHLLNLYNFWFTPRIELIVKFLSFGDRLMPRVLGVFNSVLWAWLYLYFFSKPKHKKGIIKR